MEGSLCCCPILEAYDHGCMLIRWIWNRALPHYPLEVETDKSDITDSSFVRFAISAISWLQTGGFLWLTGSICKCFELISGHHFQLPLWTDCKIWGAMEHRTYAADSPRSISTTKPYNLLIQLVQSLVLDQQHYQFPSSFFIEVATQTDLWYGWGFYINGLSTAS